MSSTKGPFIYNPKPHPLKQGGGASISETEIRVGHRFLRRKFGGGVVDFSLMFLRNYFFGLIYKETLYYDVLGQLLFLGFLRWKLGGGIDFSNGNFGGIAEKNGWPPPPCFRGSVKKWKGPRNGVLQMAQYMTWYQSKFLLHFAYYDLYTLILW